jgi:hypothetical protein
MRFGSLLLALCIYGIGSAQLILSPCSVTAEGDADDLFIEPPTTVLNAGIDTPEVVWNIVDWSYPDEWDVTFQDPNNDWAPGMPAPIISSYDTIGFPLPPGDSVNQLDNFGPMFILNGHADMGWICIKVYDQKNPSNNDVCKQFVIANPAVGIDRSLVELKLFPNPAKDYLNIEGLESQKGSWKIYDHQGKELLAGTEMRISLYRFAAGNYLILWTEQDSRKQYYGRFEKLE